MARALVMDWLRGLHQVVRSGQAMIPIAVISSAWLEAEKTSHPDMAGFLGIDLQGGVPGTTDNRCPKCGNHPADSVARIFVPVSETSTAERVDGRESVRCLCGTTYWYAAVHALGVHDPIGEARVRAASVALTPRTGAIEGQGQQPVTEIKIHVHEDVVVNPGPATAGGGSCGPTVVITGVGAVTFPVSAVSGYRVVVEPGPASAEGGTCGPTVVIP